MASSSSFLSSPLPSLPLSFIATDSNRSIHLLTFAPHSLLFPSLSKPNRPCGPAALRVRAQSRSWELNRGPERPKSTLERSYPSFDSNKLRRDKIKQELLDAIHPLDRGAKATYEDQKRIAQVADELKEVNPTEEPLQSNLLIGKWELLYTNSTSILQKKRLKYSPSWVKTYQSIEAKADSLHLDSERVAVKFGKFEIAYLIPIKVPGPDQVEITYLDEKICVYRDNQKNLFILQKEKTK